MKARSFPYFLTKAKARAELDAALSQNAAASRYKIVAHPLTPHQLELDIAQGKVAF